MRSLRLLLAALLALVIGCARSEPAPADVSPAASTSAAPLALAAPIIEGAPAPKLGAATTSTNYGLVGVGSPVSVGPSGNQLASDAGTLLVLTDAGALAPVRIGAPVASSDAVRLTDYQSGISALASQVVFQTTHVDTTAPLTGGGALSGNLTLGISAATDAGAGTMSAADFAKLASLSAAAQVPTTANGVVITSDAGAPDVAVADATTSPGLVGFDDAGVPRAFALGGGLYADGGAIVAPSVSWPGTSSQLTSGSGEAVSIGSGLSLSGGTLTATGSFVTVFDHAWSANSGTSYSSGTYTIDGVPVGMSVSGGATLVADSTGLLATYASGSQYAGPTWGLTSAAYGSSVLHGRWRLWLYYQNGARKEYAQIGGRFAGSPLGGVAIDQQNGNVFAISGSASASAYNLSTNAIWRTTYNVVVVEGNAGSFGIYFGTWSGGWPALSALVPFAMWRPAAADISTSSNGSGMTYPASTNTVEQLMVGTTGGSSSVYLYNSRLDVAP